MIFGIVVLLFAQVDRLSSTVVPILGCAADGSDELQTLEKKFDASVSNYFKSLFGIAGFEYLQHVTGNTCIGTIIKEVLLAPRKPPSTTASASSGFLGDVWGLMTEIGDSMVEKAKTFLPFDQPDSSVTSNPLLKEIGKIVKLLESPTLAQYRVHRILGVLGQLKSSTSSWQMIEQPDYERTDLFTELLNRRMAGFVELTKSSKVDSKDLVEKCLEVIEKLTVFGFEKNANMIDKTFDILSRIMESNTKYPHGRNARSIVTLFIQKIANSPDYRSFSEKIEFFTSSGIINRVYDAMLYSETVTSSPLTENYLNAISATRALLETTNLDMANKELFGFLSAYNYKLTEATREAREKDYASAARILWDTFGSIVAHSTHSRGVLSTHILQYKSYLRDSGTPASLKIDESYESWVKSGFQAHLDEAAIRAGTAESGLLYGPRGPPPDPEFVARGRAVMRKFLHLGMFDPYPGPTRSFIWTAFTHYHRFASNTIQRLIIKRLLDKIAKCSTKECFEFRVGAYTTRVHELFSPPDSSVMDQLSRIVSDSSVSEGSSDSSLSPWYKSYRSAVTSFAKLIEEYAVESSSYADLIQRLVGELTASQYPKDISITRFVRDLWTEFDTLVSSPDFEFLLQSDFKAGLDDYKSKLKPFWDALDRELESRQYEAIKQADLAKQRADNKAIAFEREWHRKFPATIRRIV